MVFGKVSLTVCSQNWLKTMSPASFIAARGTRFDPYFVLVSSISSKLRMSKNA